MRRSKIRKPTHLEKGNVIGIVAPARAFDRDAFRLGVKKLKEFGFRVKYDRTIYSKYWLMAGDDKKRANEINRMFADKGVKAILCATAGYGSIRTIPYLDKKAIRNNPKIFLGYSDITILLSYLQRTGNFVVFHGPVVAGEINDNINPTSLKYTMRVLTEARPLGELSFSTTKVLRPGKATGRLVGGNMSLIMSAIGTPYDIETDGKILFFEDVHEDLETIDKYLMQLKLAGKFRRIKGIIFGRMLRCTDCMGKRYNITNVLNDILHDVNVPILYGFPSGHRIQGQVNITLPLGVYVTIDSKGPKVIVEESGVK